MNSPYETNELAPWETPLDLDKSGSSLLTWQQVLSNIPQHDFKAIDLANTQTKNQIFELQKQILELQTEVADLKKVLESLQSVGHTRRIEYRSAMKQYPGEILVLTYNSVLYHGLDRDVADKILWEQEQKQRGSTLMVDPTLPLPPSRSRTMPI